MFGLEIRVYDDPVRYYPKVNQSYIVAAIIPYTVASSLLIISLRSALHTWSRKSMTKCITLDIIRKCIRVFVRIWRSRDRRRCRISTSTKCTSNNFDFGQFDFDQTYRRRIDWTRIDRIRVSSRAAMTSTKVLFQYAKIFFGSSDSCQYDHLTSIDRRVHYPETELSCKTCPEMTWN